MLNNMWNDFFILITVPLDIIFESMFTREIGHYFSNKERSLYLSFQLVIIACFWERDISPLTKVLFTHFRKLSLIIGQDHIVLPCCISQSCTNQLTPPANKFCKKMFFCLSKDLPTITIPLELFVILSMLFSSPSLYH